jgi:hypothetical protein
MKKIRLTPWDEWSEGMRQALVEDLLDDWPKMSQADREFVKFHPGIRNEAERQQREDR